MKPIWAPLFKVRLNASDNRLALGPFTSMAQGHLRRFAQRRLSARVSKDPAEIGSGEMVGIP